MAISKKKNKNGLTTRQELFLKIFPEVLDIYKAAEMSGIKKGNIMAAIRRNSVFGEKARELIEAVNKKIDTDPAFSKVGSLSALKKIQTDIENDEKLLPRDKYKLLIEIQREINRMIEGNLAKRETSTNNFNFNIKGVYDLTAGKQPVQIEQGEIEEVSDDDIKMIENE